MKTLARILCCFAAVAALAFGGLAVYARLTISDRYTLVEGQSLRLPVGAVFTQAEAEADSPNSYRVDVKLPGGITVKQVQVNVVQRKTLVPSGAPFGVKMFTRGVIVVGFSDIQGEQGRCNPARTAGLKAGDIILEINGEAVNGNRMLGQLVEQSGGAPLSLAVRRDDVPLEMTLQPVWSPEESRWRAGVWVRDSSAGIGTMTFWDPETDRFGGLGHAICDVDTGEIMPLSSGQIVGVEITGVEKGLAGDPGELQGSFVNEKVLGELLCNTHTGIYGITDDRAEDDICFTKAMPAASASEVREGEAYILTTVSGSTPACYAISIEKLSLGGGTSTKNMVIRVTDPGLLAKTGGILQGMSGSPIIQNGKLVGAVTHVLVNDPTRGYGIFIENMLDAAEQ